MLSGEPVTVNAANEPPRESAMTNVSLLLRSRYPSHLVSEREIDKLEIEARGETGVAALAESVLRALRRGERVLFDGTEYVYRPA